MSSLNKAMVIGRLGQEPETRYTQGDVAVTNMSLATSERFKDKSGQQQERTEWHKIVAWGRLAEICRDYLKKGSQVYFEGPLQTQSWEDQDGNKRYTTEIKALNMVMLDNKGDSSTSQPASNNKQAVNKSNDFSADEMNSGDDDLPF